MTTTAPFGSWESPIGAADTVAGIVRFSDIQYDDGNLFWLEGRPSEGGRSVLVRRMPDGTIEDVLPATANVRTMVHEYGGGAYLASDRAITYSEFADQRLYGVEGEAVIPITPEPPRPMALRYGDAIRGADGSLICVRETHPEEGEAANELVSVDPDGLATVIASGSDFYSSPRISMDGTKLAWIEWSHPNMPWDGTRLVVADLEDITDRIVVAGGPDESIVQPEWTWDGALVFASDRTGWWNLYQFDGESKHPVLTMEAEFAGPAWLLGFSWYGLLSGGRIVAAFWENGQHHLGIISADGQLERLDLDYSSYGYHITTDGDHTVWFVGTHPKRPSALVELDVDSGVETVIRSNPSNVGEAYAPEPRLITFPTTGGDVAFAVYYPPTNPVSEGPAGDYPPLIVDIHGGPTANVYAMFSMQTAYWTSRGIGFVDVNYRGSTGFGRAYREKLDGEWGVVDVDDAVAAAEYLASIGEVDGDRLAISGGSAGGYTTLAALAFRDTFNAGASHYGIADIEMLMGDSHKFESRYEIRLLGSDPGVWRQRSPIHSVDQIDVPVALFQGLDDKVVPPNQAILIAEALASRGIPYVHVEYEGEGHGFRKAENVINSLETELAFYGKVFGFTPAGDLPDIALAKG
ncbi:MAG: prolyl oligopeptidase family serine peptidase [Actinomycetota bacterium]|nr:prolyl oligopeptidase family serine peptidase [Actinomycetota bacterium]